MKRTKHGTNHVAHSAKYAIGIGIGISIILSIGLSALLANYVIRGAASENHTALFIFMIRSISVLIGCLIGSIMWDGKLLITNSIITLGYLVLLVAIGIAAFDGSFKSFISGAGSALAGCVAACLIKLGKHRKTTGVARYNL